MSLGEEVIIAPAVMKRAADLPKPDSKRTASAAQAPGSDDEAEAPTASVAAGSDEDVSTLNKEIDQRNDSTAGLPFRIAFRFCATHPESPCPIGIRSDANTRKLSPLTYSGTNSSP